MSKSGSIKVSGYLPSKLTSFSDRQLMVKEIIQLVWDLISGQ